MSGTATEFTVAAAARLDDYLRQVRAAVAAAPDLDAADVEADIREHVAVEFTSHARPVTLVELEAVLAALGPPAGWAPAVARPAGFSPGASLAGLKRWAVGAVGTLWRGPEDWRLAYLCLILTVLAVPTVGLSLLVGYLLARAAVALAAERGQPLGARRWLVYPPLVAVGLPLLLAVGFGPGAVAAGVASSEVAEARYVIESFDRNGHVAPRVRYQHFASETRVAEARRLLNAVPVSPMWKPAAAGLFLAVGVTLAWWVVLGLAVWAFPTWPPVVFFPLLNGYDWLHGVRLAACSGLGLLVWVGYAHRLGVVTWV